MAKLQRRTEPRFVLNMRAQMRDGRRGHDICILNISTRGLLAMAGTPPPRGEFVEISLGTVALVGQVRWSSSRRFGIILQERVDVAAIAKGDFASFKAKVRRLQPTRAQPSAAAAALESRRLSQTVNGVLVAIAFMAAAAFLCSAVIGAMGSLGKAADAMAGAQRNSGGNRAAGLLINRPWSTGERFL